MNIMNKLFLLSFLVFVLSQAYIPEPVLTVDFDPNQNQLAIVGGTVSKAIRPKNFKGPFSANDGFTFDKDNILAFEPLVPIGRYWTIDAWVKLPLKEEKSLTLVKGPTNGLVVVHEGVLGTFTEGSFHPSSVDLKKIAEGWHRITVVCRKMRQAFYVDTRRAGHVDKIAIEDIKVLGGLEDGKESFGAVSRIRAWNVALEGDQISQLNQFDQRLNSRQASTAKDTTNMLTKKAESAEEAARSAQKSNYKAQEFAKQAQNYREVAEKQLELAKKARIDAEVESKMTAEARKSANEQQEQAKLALSDIQKKYEEEKNQAQAADATRTVDQEKINMNLKAEEEKLLQEVTEVRDQITRETKDRTKELIEEEKNRLDTFNQEEEERKEMIEKNQKENQQKLYNEENMYRDRLMKLEKESEIRRNKLIEEEKNLNSEIKREQEMANSENKLLEKQTTSEHEKWSETEKRKAQHLSEEETRRLELLQKTRSDLLRQQEVDEQKRREVMEQQALNALDKVERTERQLRDQSRHFESLRIAKQQLVDQEHNNLIARAKEKLLLRNRLLQEEQMKRKDLYDKMNQSTLKQKTTADINKHLNSNLQSLTKPLDPKICQNRGPLGRKDPRCL